MSDVKELCDKCGDYRCICLSILTPEMAAVIEAAKAWAFSDGSEFGLDECEKLLSAVNALRLRETA
jgi:hypothetical protein